MLVSKIWFLRNIHVSCVSIYRMVHLAHLKPPLKVFDQEKVLIPECPNPYAFLKACFLLYLVLKPRADFTPAHVEGLLLARNFTWSTSGGGLVPRRVDNSLGDLGWPSQVRGFEVKGSDMGTGAPDPRVFFAVHGHSSAVPVVVVTTAESEKQNCH